jgi:hypothetical protein
MNQLIVSAAQSRFPVVNNPTLEWYFSVPDIQSIRIIRDYNHKGEECYRIMGYTHKDFYFDILDKIDTSKLQPGYTISVGEGTFICSPEMDGKWWFYKSSS